MRIFVSIFLITILFGCRAQSQLNQTPLVSVAEKTSTQPKLVVGIVVDQMRYDYLTRFNDKFSEGGFKRMISEGFNCKNNHYNYAPTYTGPGHASIYTGTTPKYHGIIANYWYDKHEGSRVYCVGDSIVNSVGTTTAAGKMSPHRMKTTTIGDENRLFTQSKGKTIGISIKDRGAILPAGHSANAAYWFVGDDEGAFVTSSFYVDALPKWVSNFNASGKSDSYLKTWNTLYDINSYTESGTDLNTFEGGFKGKEDATFPYDLKALSTENGGYDILKSTPYGNSILADFAIAALEGEALGKDEVTDVFTISFSSPDYIGHNFGVNSKEVQDTYIRLDQDIERLLNAFDEKVGKGNYTVFLTADHAAVNVPAYLQSLKIPSGYFNNKLFRKHVKGFIADRFSDSELVESISNNQIFLNHKRIIELDLDLATVEEALVNEIIHYEKIDKAYTAKTMQNASFTTGIEELIQNGYNQKRSGDVIYVLDPAVISYSRTGSTHGSTLNYDTHVPLLFYGNGIKKGNTLKKTIITDIAPTLSALLGINFPNAATGQPLEFVLE
ncbi:alkaline phosphatase family protein [Bizionia gelidisalsuginis]|uniref:Alkaline phosphatase family protein n=1 Tax=Bizionia gelidisalsuginis TaxID=291188 RepID=A0ABY3MCU4_9FLAO|nr:alkaline phosphatase PafA [Bizionia gelidisalsuginis]TYC16203.1 alkaline phosphatase family protein [Bizionia gelidisalsuginis]